MPTIKIRERFWDNGARGAGNGSSRKPEGRCRLGEKGGEIDLYKKISAAEDEVRELTRDKRRLEDKVEELERTLRFKEFKAPFYYLNEGDQTPYCAHCWEKEKHAVHVFFKFDNGIRARRPVVVRESPEVSRPNVSDRFGLKFPTGT